MARTKTAKNDQPVTTVQRLGSLIKSARDIMRKDKGLNGDLDRLPMLTWIMFLKFLDDIEQIREERAKMKREKFRPAIEAPYRWRDWASKEDGITGPELIAFVNYEDTTRPDGTKGKGLVTYLRGLQSKNGDDRRDVIATVFAGVTNRMESGYLLRDVINKVNGIHFNSTEEIHTLGHLYESMLKEMRDAAGDSGEFYTPRPVVRFMVEVTDPRLGETVLDPACGTGGFLVDAYRHLEKQCKTVEHRRKLQTESIYGGEAKPLPYMLGQMNLVLHGLESPQITRPNSLTQKLGDIGDRDRVDVILTNPPFGGEEERGILGNFPEDMQTPETALLFLQLVMRKLRRAGTGGRRGGRAAVIVPDSTLCDPGVAARIRRQLLDEFNLHTVVRLPPGAFAPYAESARTFILFFEAGKPTREIWYYEIAAPRGRKVCTRTFPLTNEDFRSVKDWWSKRRPTSCSWSVKREAIDNASCELIRQNPTVSPQADQGDIPRQIKIAAKSCRLVAERLESVDIGHMRTRAWDLKRLDSLLRPAGELVELEDDREYKQLTIQYHHRGVKLRESQLGSQIKTKRQFSVKGGQLAISRIDARHGAVGFIPSELDGAIITADFWAFDVVSDEILPEYLDMITGLKEFAHLCERASRGTTRRQRLRPDLFAAIQIPCPKPDTQKEIVRTLGALAAAASQLISTAAESQHLPSAAIGKLFGMNWITSSIESLEAGDSR